MELTKDMKLHGFTVRYAQALPELKATLYRMEYEKNGADLIWLDRPDDNKTFSIAFKTIPSDSTGVFHILEHSVLCGSTKYPVREPFVELLKSSLQTFLNAMTFPDKTMYPVASRNDQDFLNLVDVYMDAVLHPLSVTSPMGFRQEGWHYELDSPEGELTRNGVVYNEMKGAFVDPDEVLSYELARRIFPDNCYGFESGGHPERIPDLTYEMYLANHAKYYHPSNSYIFLDGQMDLDAVLAKLDSFLCEYDRIEVDADIPMQAPVKAEEAIEEYEIGPEDDGTDKVLIGEGWVYGDYSQQERAMACAVLAQALCGTNESPVKKALLEGGLAQDVNLMSYDGIQQNFMFLTVRNTSLEKKDEAVRTLYKVLEEQAEGLDHQQLHAILNQVEFANREKDFGRMPRGLVFAITAMESWLYGGDPAQNLSYEETFKSLRQKIDEGGFEKLLREVFLENPHSARVVLVPSKTLGQDNRARIAAELAAVKASWTPEETRKVLDDFAALRAHQSAGDTPEDLATLPQLKLSDIPEETRELPYTQKELEGVTVLRQEVETGGIAYLDLYFDADDLTAEELAALPTACSLLGELATEKHSALELSALIREKIGRFSVAVTAFERKNAGGPLPSLAVSLAVLPERKAEAAELLAEVLFTTKFDDTAAVYNLLRQSRIAKEQAVMGSGNTFASLRAGAGLNAYGAVSDTLMGIGQLRYLQAAERAFDEKGPETVRTYGDLLRKVLTRGRVTVSLTGPEDDGWLRQIIDLLPAGDKGPRAEYAPLERVAEGFSIPAGIGFAARSGHLDTLGEVFHGSMSVASNLLRLDYLWNNVRVKGGAYGVSLGIGTEGRVSFSSFRDPQCAGTLDIFAAAGTALREFVKSGESLDKYIVSTIGSTEPYMTPRQEKARAAAMYFNRRTQADEQKLRSEILHTTAADLSRCADILDKLAQAPETCVIAGQPILEACGEKLQRIESVQ